MTNIGIDQRRNQKTPPPDWIKKEYTSSKYPESTLIYVLDSTNIKRLRDTEVAEVKNNLFKTMESEGGLSNFLEGDIELLMMLFFAMR